MWLALFSIEWIRLFRRWLPWVAMALSALFVGLSLHNFYVLSGENGAGGTFKMPGLSFDLATSLDQSFTIGALFIIMIGAALMGDDYAQRTNQHWLLRGSRAASVLAKFTVLALMILILNVVTLSAGAAFGLGYKAWLTGSASVAGVNLAETGWALIYLTAVVLPYAALMLLLALITRSTFVSAAIGFAYVLVIENLAGAVFYAAPWIRWLPRNLYLSATYLLNHIGDKTVPVPDHLFESYTACLVALGYTVALLVLAIAWYRRQDVGG